MDKQEMKRRKGKCKTKGGAKTKGRMKKRRNKRYTATKIGRKG